MPATTGTADGTETGTGDDDERARERSAVDLSALIRPEIPDLVAYVPEVPPGIEVKLDANEPPPPTAPAVREAAARAMASVALERYPDPRATRLREAIAKRTGARPADLLVGAGSGEVLALVVNAVARPRRRNTQAVVLAPTPTFPTVRVTARSHGVKPVEVPLDASWDLDVAMTKRAIELMQPSVVFVASPNDPTGNRMTASRLEEVVVAAGQGGSLAILDEAFVDYAGGASLREWREAHPHLGILRTVSKIGLAALRVGWLEADPALVREIDKVRQPWNVSAPSQAATAAVLEEAWDDVVAHVRGLVAKRDALAAAIAAIDGLSVTPSEASFLWVKTRGPADAVLEHLVRDKILVRSFHGSGGRLATQLRITVGTDEDHERLLASLRAFR